MVIRLSFDVEGAVSSNDSAVGFTDTSIAAVANGANDNAETNIADGSPKTAPVTKLAIAQTEAIAQPGCKSGSPRSEDTGMHGRKSAMVSCARAQGYGQKQAMNGNFVMDRSTPK